MMATVDDMIFKAEVSARYHRRRAAFLERVSALMSVMILAAGAGAFASLFGESTFFAKVATFIVAVIGIIQVIFQVDRCAAAHRAWLGRWNAIIAEARQTVSPDALTINRWIAEQYSLEGDCVAEMRALVNDCYNRTMSALDRDGVPYRITRWQKIWMQLYSFEDASYS